MNKLAECVDKYNKGETQMFDEIYAITYRPVYVTVKLYLKQEKDVEDAMQDIYIKAAQNLHTIKDSSLAKSWLCSVSKNVCLNLLRKKTEVLLDEGKEFMMDHQSTTDEATIPESVLDKKEKSKIILDMVAELPMEQKEAVIYYYMDELPVKRVAELCACSSGTVKSRLSYARKKLSEMVVAEERKTGIKLRGLLPLPIGFMLRFAGENLSLSSEMANATLSSVHAALAGSSAQAAAATSVAGTAAAAITAKSTFGAVLSAMGTKAVILMTTVAFFAVAVPTGVAVGKRNAEESQTTVETVARGEAIQETQAQVQAQEIHLSGETKEKYVEEVIEPLTQFLHTHPGRYTVEEFMTAENVNTFLLEGLIVEKGLNRGELTFVSIDPQEQNGYTSMLIPKDEILNLLSHIFGSEYHAALEASEYDRDTQQYYQRKGIFVDGYYPFFYSDGGMYPKITSPKDEIVAKNGERIIFNYSMTFPGDENSTIKKMYVVLQYDPQSKYSCIITEFGME